MSDMGTFAKDPCPRDAVINEEIAGLQYIADSVLLAISPLDVTGTSLASFQLVPENGREGPHHSRPELAKKLGKTQSLISSYTCRPVRQCRAKGPRHNPYR